MHASTTYEKHTNKDKCQVLPIPLLCSTHAQVANTRWIACIFFAFPSMLWSSAVASFKVCRSYLNYVKFHPMEKRIGNVGTYIANINSQS